MPPQSLWSAALLLLGGRLDGVRGFGGLDPHHVASVASHAALDPGSSLVVATTTTSQARSTAFLFFFGASGAAGIARSAFPGMARNVAEIRRLGDAADGAPPGAPTVGLNLLVTGYPRDVAVSEVDKVVRNPSSVADIVTRFPVEGNYLSESGFLTYDAFKRANARADPLAVRAVFDCFAQGTNAVAADVAQRKLDSYKLDAYAVAADLLKAKLVGIASIAVLLFLLGYADVEAFKGLYDGWFPDWPGGRLWLEGGLWDPEIGVTHIPEYWI